MSLAESFPTPAKDQWRAGTPETGELFSMQEAHEMPRAELVQKLTKAANDALTTQLALNENRHEMEKEWMSRAAGNFLAGALESIDASDKTDEEKQATAAAVLSATLDGTYKGIAIDVSHNPFVASQTRKTPRESDNLRSVTIFGKNGERSYEKVKRRIGLARLIMEDPAEADYLVQADIAGLHGTRSGAIGSVLNEGLLKASTSNENGKQLVSGEIIFNDAEGQDSVSLIDWHSFSWLDRYAANESALTSEELQSRINSLEGLLAQHSPVAGATNPYERSTRAKIAQYKAVQNLVNGNELPADEKQRLIDNYPVVIGVEAAAIDMTRPPHIPDGDVVGEFMLQNDVPKENINLVLVPADRIEEATSLAAANGINAHVGNLDTYRKAFNFKVEDYR